MKYKLFFAGLFLTLTITSCTMLFSAYIRNMTNEVATVDVFIQEEDFRSQVPSSVKTAKQIVNFKGRYGRFFKDSTAIVWVDSSHFKVMIQPKTTVDLADIAGKFWNGRSRSRLKVLMTTNKETYVLTDSIYGYVGREKFQGVPRKYIIYHDIK